MKNTIFFLLALSLIGHYSAEGMPAQIIIIRHAERSEGDSLTTKGRERAAALAPYLTENKEFLTYGQLVAIYGMVPSKDHSSKRSIETVTPLSEQLKLTIIQSYAMTDYKKMVEDIKSNSTYTGKSILICWEHDLIPDIARAFGALQTPARWPFDVYDRIWIITYGKTGKASFQNFPQRLLYGDSLN